MSEKTMLERIARAMEEAALLHSVPSLKGDARNLTTAMAIAAVKAMREPTFEMQLRGAEASAFYNCNTDGPAKPHDECKTPDDWMGRGFSLGKRMVSGAETTASWQAMIDEILSE